MISLVCTEQDFIPIKGLAGIRWLDPDADYALAAAYWRGRGQELSRATWEEAHALGYRYAALVREGQIVSLAAAWRYSDQAWEVAAVGTLEAFRRRGYATRVVTFVTAHILDLGRVATCHAVEDNMAMQATARRVGFREARTEGLTTRDRPAGCPSFEERTMKPTMSYSTRSQIAAAHWQRELRQKLLRILYLDDLVGTGHGIPFDAQEVRSQDEEYGQLREIELNSTVGRRIRVLLGLPTRMSDQQPAVVSIHGHGGDRYQVYERQTPYHGFAASLTERGCITIATDVGQHEVYEAGRILMGERLWDLMRCIDYLTALPQVDTSRIGCAGLSLGGEMAMWLGAMDERVSATVSAGFLTTMDQMEHNHCMCWKFPGLRDLVDYADIYSLIAPRALQCQNGLKEPPTQFPPSIARDVMTQIKVAYSDWGTPSNANLVVHEGEHEIKLDSLLNFFMEYLV